MFGRAREEDEHRFEILGLHHARLDFGGLDAVPQRFSRALEEAAKLATPEAVRVTLPGAIIKTPAELDQWLAGVRKQVEEKLKDGPVIL